ncbi:MAG: DUF4432 family protein [Ruminococcaceae bacterium]|nr:DUF4432 family protein [Oscillospiraceae bacterium]
MNRYLGHESQLYGVEEMRLVGGKGDGMRLLEVRNGAGLAFTVSADRCADISRLTYKGDNFGYFAPCGYVAPAYYDGVGDGFLKSFTAGFLTTCGLTTVGSPSVDDGETLPLHGTIANTPCEQIYHFIDGDTIRIRAVVRDAALFARKLLLIREIAVPLLGNSLSITDTVKNIGSAPSPLQLLYHFNVGYPLLSEMTELIIPAESTTPRNAHAAEGLSDCLKMQPPTRGYEEMCFYHKLTGKANITVRNPAIGKGFTMTYDTAALPYFTEWKMMGEQDYVLGVEPGNAHPDGRDVMRAQNALTILQPGDEKSHTIKFTFMEM